MNMSACFVSTHKHYLEVCNNNFESCYIDIYFDFFLILWILLITFPNAIFYHCSISLASYYNGSSKYSLLFSIKLPQYAWLKRCFTSICKKNTINTLTALNIHVCQLYFLEETTTWSVDLWFSDIHVSFVNLLWHRISMIIILGEMNVLNQ